MRKLSVINLQWTFYSSTYSCGQGKQKHTFCQITLNIFQTKAYGTMNLVL